jgi:hypothetical protein
MAITKHTHHDSCEVEVRIGPFGPHHAQLYCVHHNTHIQWLDQNTTISIQSFFEPRKPKTEKKTSKPRSK